MMRNFITRLKLILLCCFIGTATVGCGLFDFGDGPFFTQHQIGVSNRSSQELHIEYTVEQRILDTTNFQAVANFVLIDSSLIISKNTSPELLLRQFDDYQRHGLQYDRIKNLFVKLKIYQIEGSDTTFANPDMLDEANWDYFNSDPLPFSKEIYHSYFLILEDTDFQ